MSVCFGYLVSLTADYQPCYVVDTYCISRRAANSGHDRREDMLFYGKRSGVDRHAEDLCAGKGRCPHAPDGEDEQLGDELNGK